MGTRSLRGELLSWVKAAMETGLDYLQVPVRQVTLEGLFQEILNCRACQLHKSRKNPVLGEGSSKARLMFVGEAPGAEEDEKGRPFVGASGQLLDRMIAAMGLKREEVYIANVVKCRPPSNRDPSQYEIYACIGFLKRQIALIRPKVICTLGRVASRALLGLTEKDPFSQLRGIWQELGGIWLMPTFHPSFLLRNPSAKRDAWEDLKKVMDRLREGPCGQTDA